VNLQLRVNVAEVHLDRDEAPIERGRDLLVRKPLTKLGNTSNPTANYCLVYNYYYSAVGTPTGCAMPAQSTSDDDGDVNGYY
jgi:hypothetical protein